MLIVVTLGIIGEAEARELFDRCVVFLSSFHGIHALASDAHAISSFYRGCSTFLPVFNAKVDTYDELSRRSPFCFNAICMVAAKVRDGGG